MLLFCKLLLHSPSINFNDVIIRQINGARLTGMEQEIFISLVVAVELESIGFELNLCRSE